MLDVIAHFTRQLPLPVRVAIAFLVIFVLPAPLFSSLARVVQSVPGPVPLPMSLIVWVYGGGWQIWWTGFARDLGAMAVVVAIAVPVVFAITWLWWHFGPGAMQRRKQARQELRGQLGVTRIQEVWEKNIDQYPSRSWFKVLPAWARRGWTPPEDTPGPPHQQINVGTDREAFEREVRRWD
jgi:hypothetical protein